MESTPNKSIKLAALDLGSNSFRLLIARVDDGKISVLLNRLETVRLGKNLSSSGEISPEAMGRGLEVLASFKDDLSFHKVEKCRCCGTQALREASNSPVFLEQGAAFLGLEIEIIDGHEEAKLSCLGVLAGLDSNILPPLLLIDVGGGSTEIAYLETAASPPRTISIPLGALRSQSAVTRQAGTLSSSLAHPLTDFLSSHGISPSRLRVISSGGTATALAALALGLEKYDAEKVQGCFLGINNLHKLARNLSAMSVAERNLLPALEQGRGDIILPGIELYKEILATIEVEGMIVSDYGLLEGILLSSLEQ